MKLTFQPNPDDLAWFSPSCYRQTRLHSSWENAWGSRWSPHVAMDVWKMPWDSTRCRPLRGFRSWKLLMYYLYHLYPMLAIMRGTHMCTHTKLICKEAFVWPFMFVSFFPQFFVVNIISNLCHADMFSCVVCECLDVICSMRIFKSIMIYIYIY